MADLTVAQNDKGYYLNFTVLANDGTAFNLTGYTIKLKVWKPDFPSALLVDGSCTIVVAASGTCKYLIVDGDFPDVDDYVFELELTQANVVESTIAKTLTVTESG